jgi:hypothetical protein
MGAHVVALLLKGALGLVLVALLAVSVVLVTPWGLEFVAKEVSQVLHSVLTGQLVIESIGDVSLAGVSGVDITLYDERGRLAHIDGLSVRTSVPALVRTLLKARGELGIVLDDVRLASADVDLDHDDHGELRLVRAVTPPPKATAGPETPGRPFALVVRSVGLGHLWAHGAPSDGTLVDADISDLRATAQLLPDRTQADFETAFEARALPEIERATGLVQGTADLPKEGRPWAVAHVSVQAKRVSLEAGGRLEGDRWSAFAEVPRVGPDDLREAVPDAPFTAPVGVAARADGHGDAIDARATLTLGDGEVHVHAAGRTSMPRALTTQLDARGLDLRAVLPWLPKSCCGRAGTCGRRRRASHPQAASNSTPRGAWEGTSSRASRFAGRSAVRMRAQTSSSSTRTSSCTSMHARGAPAGPEPWSPSRRKPAQGTFGRRLRRSG